MTENEANEMFQKPFYTMQELADILQVHYMTVRNWIRDGKLNAVKAGKSYRISKTDIIKFLNEGL